MRDETGRIDRSCARRIALAYPASYRVGMSSLGLQTIYRSIQTSGTMCCERVFLPEGAVGWERGEAPCSVETGARLGAFPVVAFSIAWELELIDLLRMLHWAGIPPLREERDDRHPIVVAGGPLTFSNPRLLLPFVDVVVVGEADTLAAAVLERLFEDDSRDGALEAVSTMPHVMVPSARSTADATPSRCDVSQLPAWGPIRTPHAELRDMFLVEAVRGCSRACHYCVMRRSSGGGMRVVPSARILEAIPEGARRVGLVGASVTDHPEIEGLVREIVARGISVGLSSLRADRLNAALVDALRKGGYKTLTTAMDGASERLRERVERRTTGAHLREAAKLCRGVGMERLKLYLMVGLPTETEEDIDECAGLVKDLSRLVPISLGISPFCAKRNTPLDGVPFAGVSTVDRRLERLRKRLAGAAEVRATSVRWAWVEHVLSQGGEAEGRAVLAAARAGGGFGAYRAELLRLGHKPEPG
jgi:radical SAM superfamily enzyme YgiQ (UPF0313 family)